MGDTFNSVQAQISPTVLTVGGERFELLSRAGQGVSSSVWKVRDAEQRVWALKLGHSRAEAGRLAREAERTAWVASPCLAQVVDAGCLTESAQVHVAGEVVTLKSGAPFLLMEWCEGQPLDAFESSSFGSAERKAAATLEIMADLALALMDLHSAGVAHGDVKPANILVREQDGGYEARRVDVGLGGAANRVVPQGGTVRYLAPEVFAADAKGDGRARDLYALALAVAEWFLPELRASDNPRELALQRQWPSELSSILMPLLNEHPRARPSAAWVFRSASASLGEARRLKWAAERRQMALRRSYLAVRRAEWLAAARHADVTVRVLGEPGRWLSEALLLGRKLFELRDGTVSTAPCELGELDAIKRIRWMTQLVGASAAHWPAPDCQSDDELAARAAHALEQVEPESLTLRHLTTGRGEGDVVQDSLVDVALKLGGGSVAPQLLDAAERLVERGAGSVDLALALARALRLRGELGRAITLLSRLGKPEAVLELAELWRRVGDAHQALQVLSELPSGSFTTAQLSRVSALRARIALDRGDLARCDEILSVAPESTQVLETRALAALAQGDFELAQRSLERARVYAGTDEERARISGAEGLLHHARGDVERAQQCFEAAAQHAQRASAILEEATYLTGLAAAASDRGALGMALEAAERATLLFEQLGRWQDAARASLARAAAYSSAGLVLETEQAAGETLRRAREALDVICQGFAHLAMADVLTAAPSRENDAREHAQRAANLLEQGSARDRTRAAARCLRTGLSVDAVAFDALARSAGLPVDVRLEWWGARAARAVEDPERARCQAILVELEALAGDKAPCAVRGRALASGVGLALGLGETEVARRLTAGAAEAARELRRQAPAALAAAIDELDWVLLAQASGQSGFAPEQLADVESLVRALGQHERLRPMLDQVLDALVLWTGVERGLLLLRAPGDRLVPRAARNLARTDLAGEQLRLSYSLAERALAQGQPVVAVDAAGELPEMHASVHALKLRSVLAVPLVARGQVLGVVYLDDRQRRGAFGARELAWVKLVATLASVAIADARDQLLLKRAARRAERAEAKLAQRLARRETELEVVERELARTRGLRETRYAYQAIVGESPAVCQMLAVVDRVTASDVPLLLVGESGVGKELIARAIHDNGPRAGGQFVGENCAAIPEGLLESTLFGHVRGAFTGAERPRAGLFEVASGGTLFLDEIGEMSLGMQSKLLRVLQDGEVRPVGSERARRVDVRVIAATHRDLQKMVREGRFREDLFYRLNVICIRIPPLRERTGDVERLVRHFIQVHAPGGHVTVSREAMQALSSYAWPGNVRQLENEVRRFLVIADERVERLHLSAEVVGQAQRTVPGELGLNVRRQVDALETELVTTALDKTGGNQTRAAELLGLSRFGLQKMMKRLEIAPRRSALRRVASGLSDAE